MACKADKPNIDPQPLRTVTGQALYEAFEACRDGSWWDKCEAFEAALIEAGWTPPGAVRPPQSETA